MSDYKYYVYYGIVRKGRMWGGWVALKQAESQAIAELDQIALDLRVQFKDDAEHIIPTVLATGWVNQDRYLSGLTADQIIEYWRDRTAKENAV